MQDRTRVLIRLVGVAAEDGVAWREAGPAIGDDVTLEDVEAVGDSIVAVGDVDGEPGIWLGTPR